MESWKNKGREDLNGTVKDSDDYAKGGVGPLRQNYRKEHRGCCLMALLEAILLLVIFFGGIFFLHNSDLFHRIYNIGMGHIRELPGFERLASAEDENMINEEKELVDFVNAQLQNGQETFLFRTKDLDDNFINNINSYTEAFYGSCSKYTTTDYGSYREIKMNCTLSNAYYAERYILYQEDIPSDRKDAKKLADKCSAILDKKDMDDLTEYRKEKYFHDYIIKHTVYTTEGDRDLLSSPEGPLLHGQGVCSGYARAMKLLCDLTGVKCCTVVGIGNGVDHEWNMVQIGKEWYHVDVTWDDPLPDQKYPMFAYLNLTDQAISLDHVWEKSYYHSAESTLYDYYTLNNAYCDDFEAFTAFMEQELEKQPKTVRVMVGDYSKKNYSEDKLKFLFDLSGASSYSFATCGPKGRTEIYFVFSY